MKISRAKSYSSRTQRRDVEVSNSSFASNTTAFDHYTRTQNSNARKGRMQEGGKAGKLWWEDEGGNIPDHASAACMCPPRGGPRLPSPSSDQDTCKQATQVAQVPTLAVTARVWTHHSQKSPTDSDRLGGGLHSRECLASDVCSEFSEGKETQRGTTETAQDM